MMFGGRSNNSAPLRYGTFTLLSIRRTLPCVARLRCGFEGLWLKLAIALQQNFDFAFGFLQFLPAGTGKLHALVKELQRMLEGDITLLQFGNNLFQSLEALFKLGQDQTPATILVQIGLAEHENSQ